MNVKCWGTPGWKFIHIVALAYPINPTDEDKNNYKNFFDNIQNILPCKICAHHYKLNLIKYPLNDFVLSSPQQLFNWTVQMHNEVNISNNKPVLDFESAIKAVIDCSETNNMIIQEEEKKKEEENKKDEKNEEEKNEEEKKKEEKKKEDKKIINNKSKETTNYNITFIYFIIFIIFIIIFNYYFNLKKYIY